MDVLGSVGVLRSEQGFLPSDEADKPKDEEVEHFREKGNNVVTV